MEICGHVYEHRRMVEEESVKAGIDGVKVIAQNRLTGDVVSTGYTKPNGSFGLFVPDSAFKTERDDELMLDLSVAHWAYHPQTITLGAEKDSAGKIICLDYPGKGAREVEIYLTASGPRRKRWAVITILAFLAVLVYTVCSYLSLRASLASVQASKQETLIALVEADRSDVQQTLKATPTSADSLIAVRLNRHRALLETALALIVRWPDANRLRETLETLRNRVPGDGDRPGLLRPAGNYVLEARLLMDGLPKKPTLSAFWLERWLVDSIPTSCWHLYQQNPYWWDVAFWAVFGAVIAVMWGIQAAYYNMSFEPGHCPRHLFRIVCAPFMALAFVLMGNLALQTTVSNSIDLSKASWQIIPIPFALTIAFLSGLFIERLYRRLRSFSDVIFKSDTKP